MTIELTPAFVSLLTLFITLTVSMVGIYVKLTNKITELETRVTSLEHSRSKMYDRIDDTEKESRKLLGEINKTVHDLKLVITRVEEAIKRKE